MRLGQAGPDPARDSARREHPHKHDHDYCSSSSPPLLCPEFATLENRSLPLFAMASPMKQSPELSLKQQSQELLVKERAQQLEISQECEQLQEEALVKEPVVKRFRKASEGESWICKEQPASSSTSSFSSCTTQKDHTPVPAPATEDEEVQSVCVTPKAKKHRIPLVDVDLCPPAPKKPRRLSSKSNFLPKLRFSPGYLF